MFRVLSSIGLGVPNVIHLVAYVKARQGMSREDFRNHWANVHGPLVAGIPNDPPHTAYYAQYPRLDADYDRPNSPDFDGVALQSFESMDHFNAFLNHPDVAAKLGPDGPKFMDQEKSVWFLTDEPLVVIPKAVVPKTH
jgi:uncharacterized protein (TIGR02118 family)